MKAIYIAITAMSVLGGSTVMAQTPQPLPAAYPANAKINYVRTWQALRPGLDMATIEGQPNSDVKQVTQYLDGLGRPLQEVAKGGSLATGTTPTDMVSMHLYDARGREAVQYLPYASTGADGAFKQNPFAAQQAFMQAQYGGQGETFFYGRTEFEASPASRPQKSMAAGNSWSGSNRGTEKKYWTNTAADGVRIWEVSGGLDGNFGTYSSPGTYAAGSLIKTVTVDEHGKQVAEFTDQEGRVLLKKVQLTAADDNGTGSGHSGWLCTYYIYDRGSNLHCVLQPKAVKELAIDGWQLTAGLLDELTFRYAYDIRNRMVMKKVPGAGEVYMVYDNRDRLVLTQDANLRLLGKWTYTGYDALNRPTATGLLTDSRNAAWHWAQASTSASYPILTGQTYEELTRTFYDDYTWLSAYTTPLTDSYNMLHNAHLMAASNTQWPYAQALVQSNLTKGMATGSRVKVLGTVDTYLYKISIYDDKGRAIQVQGTNASGGKDIATTQYAWNGKPLLMAITHQKSAINTQTSTQITQFTYDNLWRTIKTEKKMAHSLVKGGAVPEAFTTVAVNSYDALGELVKKEFGIGNLELGGSGPLESLTYDYNIRGWMLGANRDYIKGLGNNYFGFELAYDKPANIITGQTYTNPQYNGNISGSTWRAAGDGEKRKYDFGYDAANRLTGADFNQLTNGSFDKTAGMDFSVSGLYYDANGNILGMDQKGFKVSGSAFIDQLAYSYFPNSNRLRQVTDGVNDNASKLGDFKYDPAAKAENDYSYDANGSMVQDNNKNISSIGYNHLNLPQVITVKEKGNIEYVYDAMGNKLKKTVKETGKPDKVTEYINGFVYEDGQLQFAPHEEGCVRLAKQYYLNGDSAWTLQYDYFLKDHLGNIRTVLTAQKDTSRYAASFETAVLPKEAALFANIYETAFPISNINKTGLSTSCEECVLPPTGTNYPADNTTVPNAFTSRLNGQGKRIGAAITLKVMAGDKVDLGTKVWYPQSAVEGNWENVEAEDVLASLVNTLGGQAAGLSSGKASPAELSGTGGPLLGGIGSFLDSHPDDPGNEAEPRAYLNWLLLDEQFNYVPNGSGYIRIPGYDDNMQTLAQQGLPVVKSGYLFVYLSNETKNRDVFFDNLTVQHYTGPLSEECNYYPFGLLQKGISSRASGRFKNNEKKFQGQRFDDELGLDWIQFKWRNHDPQLGRFIEIDPLSENYVYNSTYAFSENKVVAHVELEGLESVENRTRRNEEAYLKGEITEEKYRQNIKGPAVGGVLGGIISFGCMFPSVAGPIIASYVFGVPSPSAPYGGVTTSVAILEEGGVAASNTKTAASTVRSNAANGAAFEQKVGSDLVNSGNTNIATQITIKANSGVKTRVDFVSKNKSGQIVLTEAKSSATAPLTGNQKLAFPAIAQTGGVVVGKGKSYYPGGTIIPPTQVNVVRPSTMADNTHIRVPIPGVPLNLQQN